MEALKPATYEDLCAVPDNRVAEIIAGTLYTSPRPAPRHANAASVLGGRLNPRWQLGDGGPGGWWILHEPELHLGEHVVVPDIGGWMRTTLPGLPTAVAWFGTRPDWVCEILSPSTARLDRGVKLDVYAQAGIPWVWLVDPDAKLVEVFRLVDGAWVRHAVAHDQRDAALPPFDAVPLDVSELWLD
ncbi:MAG: Uma2 family endonuclease [Alphaproteobacteria bacterium]|nr:Uma2 family endonuclease [Alphaproteobacteria bacterium]